MEGIQSVNTPTLNPEQVIKMSGAVVEGAEAVKTVARIVRFRNRAMVLSHDPYDHFIPLTTDLFATIAYPILGGITRSRLADVLSYLSNTAEDLTGFQHLILFGAGFGQQIVDEKTDVAFVHANKPRVWNMETLDWEISTDPDLCVWRSPYAPVPLDSGNDGKPVPIPFIMSLAGGDQAVYDDMMQALAPLIMEQKPDGAIWFVGDGANGKSTLMDAIWRIFPGQLSSITVKRLADGRDTPSLNGTLANVVKESSEGRIDDTETYKAIGTHEDFRVHKFHSQDDVTIKGNLHHIFSANNIPAFNDKGWSARRRTFVVPFDQRFESDPTFERRMFTPLLFGQLITEMARYAKILRGQTYRYKFSSVTQAAKVDYDTEANNAEEYAKTMYDQGVRAFDSFTQLRLDYENWCSENGYVPLGVGNLRRAMKVMGFERVMIRAGDNIRNQYRVAEVADAKDLQLFGLGRPGLYVLPAFQKARTDEPLVPENFKPAKETVPPDDRRRQLREW